MKRRPMITLAAGLLMACTTERAASPAAESEGSRYALHQKQQQNGVLARRLSAPPEESVPVTFGESEVSAPPPLPEIATNMIIRTATASIEVDSLEPAVARVKELATRLGGYVGSSGIVTGKNQLRQAAIEVKIPAGRFDEVLSGLARSCQAWRRSGSLNQSTSRRRTSARSLSTSPRVWTTRGGSNSG